jgi:hypothetical protein
VLCLYIILVDASTLDRNAIPCQLFLFAEVQVQRFVKRNNTESEEKVQTVVNYATKAGYHEELSKNGAEEQNARDQMHRVMKHDRSNHC